MLTASFERADVENVFDGVEFLCANFASNSVRGKRVCCVFRQISIDTNKRTVIHAKRYPNNKRDESPLQRRYSTTISANYGPDIISKLFEKSRLIEQIIKCLLNAEQHSDSVLINENKI